MITSIYLMISFVSWRFIKILSTHDQYTCLDISRIVKLTTLATFCTMTVVTALQVCTPGKPFSRSAPVPVTLDMLNLQSTHTWAQRLIHAHLQQH